MNKITTLNFGENFIERLGQYLDEHFVRPGKDLSRVAIVFGGKRPALFVKRELNQKIQKSFYPPRFLSIDELITTIIRKQGPFQAANDLDQCYVLYRLAQQHCPQILVGRETFAQFLPWTREIAAFIDQMDLESILDDQLRNIQANAQIGYAVPEDINRLLENIVVLRQAYHAYMQQTKIYSRGFQYRQAAQLASKTDFPEWDTFIFCNFFYFNKSEAQVAKSFYDRGLAHFIFQGDEERWPTLKHTSRLLGEPIREHLPKPLDFKLYLYSAFDGHSQVAMAREILKGIDTPEKTVIVLPDPGHIIPLVAEISPLLKDFNISMGYPLKRSSVYSLLDFIFRSQLSMSVSTTTSLYYTRDYLRVIRHPLVKNLDFGSGSAVMRVLIHKIEDLLTGIVPNVLAGHMFIVPEDIEKSDDYYLQVQETLKGMGLDVTRSQLQEMVKQIHSSLFTQWETIKHFADFAMSLDRLLKLLVEHSFLKFYPLNLKIVERIYGLKEEIETVSFNRETFPKEDIFKIFASRMEKEIHSFTGSPLKGLQILGLFETRALNFDHVIVLDANEGLLPKLNVYEPLIPREVMITLNLDRLEQDEEIQRYQFMRLIAGAKHVHLICEESAKKEKSRFVEELVWEQEQKSGQTPCVPVTYPGFRVRVMSRPQSFSKTRAMIDFLKSYRYSASSINTYLRSPVEFYYSYVLGLREKEDLLQEPENRQVGTFVHEILEMTFKKFIGKKPVLDNKFFAYFQTVLEERFAAGFGKGRHSDAFLLKTVLESRLNRFLEFEKKRCESQISELMYIEKKFEDQIPLAGATINFSYRVDRVDQLTDGTVLIVDYKTGSIDPMPRAIETIENMELSRENIRDSVISFQVPLYYYYLTKAFKTQPVNAAYYNLRTLEINSFMDEKMRFEPERINTAFLRALDFIILEIFDPNVPFCDFDKTVAH